MINLILEIIFVLLVATDTVLTYKVLEREKGHEKKTWEIKWPIKLKLPTLMGICINHPILTIAITIIGAGIILLLTIEANMVWFLIFPSVAFGYACWRSWEALK